MFNEAVLKDTFPHHLLPNHCSLIQDMCLWHKYIVILGTLILKMTKSTASDSN